MKLYSCTNNIQSTVKMTNDDQQRSICPFNRYEKRAKLPRGSGASVSVLNRDERLLNLSLINVDDDV